MKGFSLGVRIVVCTALEGSLLKREVLALFKALDLIKSVKIQLTNFNPEKTVVCSIKFMYEGHCLIAFPCQISLLM